MASLHYLTVQDVLWINLQITKRVNPFNYAKLEEATYYQYAYGDSHNVIHQAARLATGFLKLQPLEVGNAATNFVALITFLRINGLSEKLADSKGGTWFESLDAGSSLNAVESIATKSGDHHGATDIRTTVSEVIRDYPKTLKSLLDAVPA